MKYDWYQSDSLVTISVMTKNCKEEELSIVFNEQEVLFTRQIGDTKEELQISLSEPIKHEQATYKILSTKVELKVPKTLGGRWTTLEKEKNLPTTTKSTKNWDGIAVEEDEPEGDQALNSLFQKIYKDADENTRKAMNKSFMESGGTVLSTNWSEVGQKKIDVQPPEGMEFKKYEQ